MGNFLTMRKGRRLFVWAAAILVAAPAPVRSSPADAVSFSLLSYNVHGLFRLAAEQSPAARSRTIGWLASRYDVVLLQEDFESYKAIKKEMRGRRGKCVQGWPYTTRCRFESRCRATGRCRCERSTGRSHR